MCMITSCCDFSFFFLFSFVLFCFFDFIFRLWNLYNFCHAGCRHILLWIKTNCVATVLYNRYLSSIWDNTYAKQFRHFYRHLKRHVVFRKKKKKIKSVIIFAYFISCGFMGLVHQRAAKPQIWSNLTNDYRQNMFSTKKARIVDFSASECSISLTFLKCCFKWLMLWDQSTRSKNSLLPLHDMHLVWLWSYHSLV